MTVYRPRVQNGWTALIGSAENGHAEVARLLLDSRADIHAATQVRRAAQGVRTRPANILRAVMLGLTRPFKSPAVAPRFTGSVQQPGPTIVARSESSPRPFPEQANFDYVKLLIIYLNCICCIYVCHKYNVMSFIESRRIFEIAMEKYKGLFAVCLDVAKSDLV